MRQIHSATGALGTRYTVLLGTGEITYPKQSYDTSPYELFSQATQRRRRAPQSRSPELDGAVVADGRDGGRASGAGSGPPGHSASPRRGGARDAAVRPRGALTADPGPPAGPADLSFTPPDQCHRGDRAYQSRALAPGPGRRGKSARGGGIVQQSGIRSATGRARLALLAC